MARQVYAIFVFMGVVVLSTAFLQTRDMSNQIAEERVDVSSVGVANALVALREAGQDKPFGLEGAGEPQEQSVPQPQHQNQQEEEEPVIIEYIDPTFCDVVITQPEVGVTVSSQISVVGFVGVAEDPECFWTVFEANAGGVQVFGEDGSPLSDHTILSSVGDWMQLPSYFGATVSLNQVPSSSVGYLRFVEHDAQNGQPDIFLVPVMFSTYQQVVDQEANQGFFDSVTTFFKRKQEIADIPDPVLPPPDFTGLVKRSESSNESIVLPNSTTPDGISFGDSEDYCEIKNVNNLICYGSYVDASKESCGCDTFPSLQTYRSQTTLKVDVEALKKVSFDTTLFWGDRGDRVRELQRALYVLAYYEYELPSGIYDNETRRAVAELQKENGISGAGVIVGRKTRALLDAIFDTF